MTPTPPPPAGNYCEQHRKGGIQSSTVSAKPCDVCGATPSKAGFAAGDEKKAPGDMTDAELIEAVAAEVMDWKPRPNMDRQLWHRVVNGLYQSACMLLPEDWNPITDWNHTWEVIEAMKKRKCCILIEWQKVVDWNVAILPNHVMAGLLGKNDGKVPEEAYMHEGDNGLQKTILLAALLTIRSSPHR